LNRFPRHFRSGTAARSLDGAGGLRRRALSGARRAGYGFRHSSKSEGGNHNPPQCNRRYRTMADVREGAAVRIGSLGMIMKIIKRHSTGSLSASDRKISSFARFDEPARRAANAGRHTTRHGTVPSPQSIDAFARISPPRRSRSTQAPSRPARHRLHARTGRWRRLAGQNPAARA